MKAILGYTGDGNNYDKERGHDIVATPSLDPEWRKTSGVIAANSTTPIQFCWDVSRCLLPTIQLVSSGVAKVTVQIYASNNRLASYDNDQDETMDPRAATWKEVTASYLAFGAAGATAAPATAAATMASAMLFPSEALGLGFRPAWLKLVITPDGTVATADAFDCFARATDC